MYHTSKTNDLAETSCVASERMCTGILHATLRNAICRHKTSFSVYFGTPGSLGMKIVHEDARGGVSTSLDFASAPRTDAKCSTCCRSDANCYHFSERQPPVRIVFATSYNHDTRSGCAHAMRASDEKREGIEPCKKEKHQHNSF